MGCLLAIIAAISPRVAVILLWLFTNLVDRAFNGFLVPLLGVIFFPVTTLLYVLVYRPVTGVSTLGWVVVAIGVLIDLTTFGGGMRARRR